MSVTAPARKREARQHTRVPMLRPYQRQILAAVMRSVDEGAGLTFTVQIARQGGKNEVSAQIEQQLLLRHSWLPVEAIKCAPTYRPQLRVSMRRLMMRMSQADVSPLVEEKGAAVTVGDARIHFLSAEGSANVVGHTASLLLEVDEAQAVDPEKFDREFRPMAAAENATIVFYGIPWDDRTLLERAKQHNLEAERSDGIRRHFEYDWQVVARYNPSYRDFVEKERARLGETHPAFLTQYCVKAVAGGGRLLSGTQRAQLQGSHGRQQQPRAGEAYVAGLDLAGGDNRSAGLDDEQQAGGRVVRSPHDATVLTVGRLMYPGADALVQQPRIEIVEQVMWSGEPHELLAPRLIDLLRDVWRVTRVSVDASGLGETLARMLAQVLGEHRVDGVKFSASSKSQLGFDLLAAINGGRLKMYAADDSSEYREFWRQAELARVVYRANATMNFFVDEAEGHDDVLMSTALLVRASRDQQRRRATGSVRV